jgi:diadenylate cyclase
LSIFYPASPLHDGAAILRKDKIVAAGVILPITENPKLSYRYGTRHRAALGLSEIYDGLCIVVSEETGAISLASRGMLMRLTDADELNDPLSYMYDHESTDRPSNPLQLFLSVFGRPRRGPLGFKGQIDRIVEDKPESQGSEEPEGEKV